MRRIRKVIVFAVLAAPILILSAVELIQVKSKEGRLPVDMYELAEKCNAVDHTYDAFLSRAAGLIVDSMDVRLAVSVNRPYESTAINLYIFRTENLGRGKCSANSSRLNGLFSHIQGNFAAVPPNIVAMDSKLFGAFFYHVSTEVIGLIAANGIPAPNIPERGGLAPVNAYWRIRMLRGLSNGDDLHKFRVDGRAVKKIMSTPEVFNSICFAIIPVLAHEIGHLNQETSGSFSGASLDATIIDYLGNAEKVHEKNADDFAAEALRRFIPGVFAGDGLDDTSSVLLSHARISSEFFFRDLVLQRAVDKFRGINLEDLLVGIELKCPGLGIDADFPVLPSGIGEVTWEEFPIVTSEELRTLTASINAAASARLHAHIFERSRGFISAPVDLGTTGPDPLQADAPGFAFLVQLATRDRPRFENIQRINEYAPTGISADRIIELISKITTLRKGVNCPSGECLVGVFPAGFIELITEKGVVRRARLVIRRDPALMDEHIMNTGILAEFLLTLYPEDSEDAAADILFSGIRQIAACRGSWFRHNEEGFSLVLRRVNDSEFFSLEVHGAEIGNADCPPLVVAGCQ